MPKKIILFSIISAAFLFGLRANAATISPLIIEVDLDPGQSQQLLIKLYNETDAVLYFNGSVESFKPKGESGEAEILPKDVANQARDWVKLPLNALSLKPGEIIQVPMMIEVPKTAEVGGYYLAAMWRSSPAPAGQNRQVGVASRVGTLVLLRVKGEAREQISFLDFFAFGQPLFNWGSYRGRSAYNYLPVNFLARLENSGNVHLKPSGQLIVKNIFGRVVATAPFNEAQSHVLPQSVKIFSVTWPPSSQPAAQPKNLWAGFGEEIGQFAFGRYSAQLQVEYGEKRERIYSPEISFWIVPWRLLSAGAVILAVLIFWWYRQARRRRNAKKAA